MRCAILKKRLKYKWKKIYIKIDDMELEKLQALTNPVAESFSVMLKCSAFYGLFISLPF